MGKTFGRRGGVAPGDPEQAVDLPADDLAPADVLRLSGVEHEVVVALDF